MAGTPLAKFVVGKKSIAAILGISASTVERWRKRYKNFPVYKKGGMLFADPVNIATWLLTNEQERAEIAELNELRKVKEGRR